MKELREVDEDDDGVFLATTRDKTRLTMHRLCWCQCEVLSSNSSPSIRVEQMNQTCL